MRSFLLFIFGISIGFWFSWPGILTPKNWYCFSDIIKKSINDEISLKAVSAVSPKFLLRRKNNNLTSKIRIVSDACFR